MNHKILFHYRMVDLHDFIVVKIDVRILYSYSIIHLLPYFENNMPLFNYNKCIILWNVMLKSCSENLKQKSYCPNLTIPIAKYKIE